MNSWPTIPPPLYAQPFEANHLREVSHYSPQRHPGGYSQYNVSWKYIYTLPTFDDISDPTVWPII
jgi:hypothetical protein